MLKLLRRPCSLDPLTASLSAHEAPTQGRHYVISRRVPSPPVRPLQGNNFTSIMFPGPKSQLLLTIAAELALQNQLRQSILRD